MSTPDGEVRADAGPDRRRLDTRGRLLLVLAVLLVGAAAAVVVLVDDARWLRLGVVAALWAALIGALVTARRAPARDAAPADQRLEVLRRRHERELSREAAAREDEVANARREAETASRDEIAALREEVARLHSHADATTMRRPEAPPARLRVVGAGPTSWPRTRHGPATPVPSPADRPARPVSVVPATRPVSAPPPRAAPTAPAAALRPPGPPRADPSVVAAGSFVDQYVRAAGVDTGAEHPPGAEGDRVPGGAANRIANPGWGDGSATTGRTVAELLAAHAAPGGPGGRRRRGER